MLQPQHFSDIELFKLLQHKNENALSYLYDKYASSLFGAILKLVKNDKLAAEILEKVFLSIWNNNRTLSHPKQSIFVWMYSIAYKMTKAELSNLALCEHTFPELVARCT
ncbi:MAG: hypothetical protein WKF91_11795 [Segetibacter sp.]